MEHSFCPADQGGTQKMALTQTKWQVVERAAQERQEGSLRRRELLHRVLCKRHSMFSSHQTLPKVLCTMERSSRAPNGTLQKASAHSSNQLILDKQKILSMPLRSIFSLFQLTTLNSVLQKKASQIKENYFKSISNKNWFAFFLPYPKTENNQHFLTNSILCQTLAYLFNRLSTEVHFLPSQYCP